MNPWNTRILRAVFATAAAIGLSACANVERVDYNNYQQLDTASRAAPLGSSLGTPAEAAPVEVARAAGPSAYKVMAVSVNVPDSLSVSEANRFYPGGDIVWREDPIGNRHEQVKAIMAAGLTKGAERLNGGREVFVEVIVRRFHALTEKARYSLGGVHAIQFDLRVRDANTGEVLIAPKLVRADFGALGGQAAIQAEARGITQKVRIIDHLAHVLEQELTTSVGYVSEETGLLGAINQL